MHLCGRVFDPHASEAVLNSLVYIEIYESWNALRFHVSGPVLLVEHLSYAAALVDTQDDLAQQGRDG